MHSVTDSVHWPKRFVLVFLSVQLLIVQLFIGAGAMAQGLNDAFHDDFDSVLRAHVSDGRVDYPAIARDVRFSRYLERLATAQVTPDLPLPERLAFWVNAYNALAIDGILSGGSPSSLLGRLSYFKRDKYEVAGREITLYDLERDVIIPLGDNRIHFAIVCASASCPPLLAEAYVPSKIDEQLEAQSIAFVNDPTKNTFDLARQRMRVSKIFDWFKDDFAAEAGSVQDYVARYVRDTSVKAALTDGAWRVRHHKYDWSLNGIAPDEG